MTTRLDLRGLKEFDEFAERHFQFAISHAMNMTAKGEAVNHLRRGLSSPDGARFTVRNKYTPGGIRFFKAASKHDLTVKVGAISDYLRAATEGTHDDDRPDGGRSIGAVPLGPTRQPITTTTARRNDWPMQLIARGLAFRPGIDHTRKRLAVQGPLRPGQRRRTAKDRPDPLKPGDVLFSTRKHPSGWGTALWLIADDSTIDLHPRYPAVRLTREAFDAAFPDKLRKSVRKAIRSRRRQ